MVDTWIESLDDFHRPGPIKIRHMNGSYTSLKLRGRVMVLKQKKKVFYGIPYPKIQHVQTIFLDKFSEILREFQKSADVESEMTEYDYRLVCINSVINYIYTHFQTNLNRRHQISTLSMDYKDFQDFLKKNL